MLRAAPFALGLAASVVLLAAPRPAGACGGVMPSSQPLPGQPPETITVAAQRMAYAISTTQTTLWSQIAYDGNPSDFAWVIPVGQGAYVEEATDAWLEALDTFTSTHVSPPRVVCTTYDGAGDSGGGCGCGSALGGDGAPGAADPGGGPGFSDPDVTVIHQGSVGPYETVTLDAANGLSAQQWLMNNGYAVTPEVASVLDEYAFEGMNFLALRLQPGANVRQMTPVRVIAPGASAIVPMRMMVAGAGERVPVTLFVIGEGRYVQANFPSAVLSPDALSWDFTAASSNYAELRAAALAGDEGRAFLTTFAMWQPFTTPLFQPDGEPVSITVNTLAGFEEVNTLVDLYFMQAAANAGQPGSFCNTRMEEELENHGGLPVVTECADNSAEPGLCPDGMAVAASTFECDGFTDLAVAMTGIHPNDVWITRIEADLPVDALTEDLELEASSSQTGVSSWLTASAAENVPCADYTIENGSQPLGAPLGSPRGSAALALMGAGALGSIARRRRQGKG